MAVMRLARTIVVFAVVATACTSVEPTLRQPTDQPATSTSTSTTPPDDAVDIVIDLPPLPTPPAPLPACRVVLDMTREREIPYNCKLDIE